MHNVNKLNGRNEWQDCTDAENDYFAALEAREEAEELENWEDEEAGDDRGFLRAYDEMKGSYHRTMENRDN